MDRPRHERPAAGPAHTVDEDAPLSPAARARTIAAAADAAALGTLLEGAPFVSPVAAVLDDDGSALLLLSEIAEHTKALTGDDRASLLFVDAPAGGDPSALARVTFLGRCVPVGDGARAAATARYVAARPHAATVATFSDFRPYRLAPERVRFIGGFGRAAWIPPSAFAEAAVDPIAARRAEALALLAPLREGLVAVAAARVGRAAATGELLSADARGIDLLLRGGGPPQAVRLAFPAAVALSALEAAAKELLR